MNYSDNEDYFVYPDITSQEKKQLLALYCHCIISMTVFIAGILGSFYGLLISNENEKLKSLAILLCIITMTIAILYPCIASMIIKKKLFSISSLNHIITLKCDDYTDEVYSVLSISKYLKLMFIIVVMIQIRHFQICISEIMDNYNIKKIIPAIISILIGCLIIILPIAVPMPEHIKNLQKENVIKKLMTENEGDFEIRTDSNDNLYLVCFTIHTENFSEGWYIKADEELKRLQTILIDSDLVYFNNNSLSHFTFDSVKEEFDVRYNKNGNYEIEHIDEKIEYENGENVHIWVENEWPGFNVFVQITKNK